MSHLTDLQQALAVAGRTYRERKHMRPFVLDCYTVRFDMPKRLYVLHHRYFKSAALYGSRSHIAIKQALDEYVKTGLPSALKVLEIKPGEVTAWDGAK